jgi:ribonuclease HII
MGNLFDFDNDYGVVVGTDEAGRGPAAGGVFAAAVYFPEVTEGLIEDLARLNDSKKLSEVVREKLYDVIVSSGLWDAIAEVIPEKEIDLIDNMIKKTLKGVYTYTNSIYGILDNVVADYGNMDLNAGDIQKKLADPENLSLVKEILTKLG